MRYAILLLVITLSCSCSSGQETAPELVARVNEIKPGYRFPDDAWLIDVAGDTITFAALRGEWTIVDYWSAGCQPCVAAFPLLRSLAAKDSSLNVLAISVDRKFSRFQKYHRRYAVGFPNYFAGFNLANPFLLANLRVLPGADRQTRLTTRTPRYLLLNPEGVITEDDLPKPGSSEFYAVLEHMRNKDSAPR